MTSFFSLRRNIQAKYKFKNVYSAKNCNEKSIASPNPKYKQISFLHI